MVRLQQYPYETYILTNALPSHPNITQIVVSNNIQIAVSLLHLHYTRDVSCKQRQNSKDMQNNFFCLFSNPVTRFSDVLYYLSSDGRKTRRYTDYVHKVAREVIAERKITLVCLIYDENWIDLNFIA